MKIALLLTGFPRTYETTFENLKKNILNKYDTDIYISSWNKSQLRSGDSYIEVDVPKLLNKYSDWKVKYQFFDVHDHQKNRFDCINFLNRNYDVFKTNSRAIEHGSYWVERLRDQWFIVKNGFNLIDNPNQYDLIMRLRFDILLTDIQLKNEDFVIPKDIGGWSYSDHFAYGKIDSMRKYCNIFDNIQDMYYTYNIDISHATDMVKFYMEKYNNPIKTTIDSTITYTILK
jgi:hypothetical protein